MSNKGHKAQNIFDSIKSFFQKYDVDMKNCRGQSYDNASVMSGQYNGVQALVNRENSLAFYIPCYAHSLNLVGTAAMTCCLETKKFFDFLENVYTFFTVSSERYDMLIQKLKLSVQNTKERASIPKRVSIRRWESRAQAVESLHKNFRVYKNVLQEMSSENNEAQGLHAIMSRLETCLYIEFWNDILNAVNKISLKLQSCDSDLNTSIGLLITLKLYVESIRENFENYETVGKEKSDSQVYELNQKRTRRQNLRLNPLDYGKEKNTEFTDFQKFRVECYLPVIDQIITSLTQRIAAYEKVENYFGFLRKLDNLSPQEIKEHSLKLIEVYEDDLEENLTKELVQFKEFTKVFIINDISRSEEEKTCFEYKMYQLIIEKDLQETFPNIKILLKIYLTLMTTNCTSERSFSKLKLIKNRLRASMTQDTLNNYALMSIESDLLRQMSYADIISDFAEKKACRVIL